MEFCIFTEPQYGASYNDQLAAARAAEASGFDAFFRSDHYLTMADDGLPGPTDAWTTLAGLARETTTIRLGTLVSSVTYRAPGILAIQVAQVDQMSGGRAELGLGTGWFEAEHRAYGIPFPPKRFDLLEEQLEIVNGLWSTPLGETYSFNGMNYRLTDSPALPKPVQERVPVIVGGGGPKRTPALAARFATEYNIGFVDDAGVAAAFGRVREACEAEVRDPATLKLSVARTTLAGASGDANQFTGSDAQIVDQVGALADLGAQRVYFQLMDMRDLDRIAALGSEVVSHFR
ncbi:MAG: LLM class F420-dependent oxidoreductase [Microbacterium sp.]